MVVGLVNGDRTTNDMWPVASPVSLASMGRCGFPTAKKNWREHDCSALVELLLCIFPQIQPDAGSDLGPVLWPRATGWRARSLPFRAILMADQRSDDGGRAGGVFAA